MEGKDVEIVAHLGRNNLDFEKSGGFNEISEIVAQGDRLLNVKLLNERDGDRPFQGPPTVARHIQKAQELFKKVAVYITTELSIEWSETLKSKGGRNDKRPSRKKFSVTHSIFFLHHTKSKPTKLFSFSNFRFSIFPSIIFQHSSIFEEQFIFHHATF
jgi:hypothetical protein